MKASSSKALNNLPPQDSLALLSGRALGTKYGTRHRQKARKQLALLVRRLASGSITNDQFEDQLPASEESALHDIYFYGVWPLYDDFVEHKLKNQWSLSQEGANWVGRIVLFLQSEKPYRYPKLMGYSQLPVMLLSIITLGWFGRFWLRYKWRDGEHSVWPFFSQLEYEEALKRPVFLCGKAQQHACVGRSEPPQEKLIPNLSREVSNEEESFN
jgi:hypothetical protein